MSYGRIAFIALVVPFLVIPPLQTGIGWASVVSTAMWVVCNPVGTIDIIWDFWSGFVVGLVTLLVNSIGLILIGAFVIVSAWGC